MLSHAFRRPFVLCCALSAAPLLAAPTAHASDPWADEVVSYDPGLGAPAAFQSPTTALGQPTRFTGESLGFPGPTSPFSAAFEGDEVVSIGLGGSLVVRFDQPVTDDPLNPFGIDLLVFGNAFYFGPDNTAFAEGGSIEVSPDGVTWTLVAGAVADGAFPTLGYRDIADPFQSTPGSVLTDFTRPVDPSLSVAGLSFPQLLDAYDGSGGGTGVDLGALGLGSISYVRITDTLDDGLTPDIDAFADVARVPAPGAGAIAGLLALGGLRRRRDRA